MAQYDETRTWIAGHPFNEEARDEDPGDTATE